MHALRVSVFDHIQRQSLAFFKRTRRRDRSACWDIAGIRVLSRDGDLVASIPQRWPPARRWWCWVTAVSRVVGGCPPAVWLTRRVALVRQDLTGQRQG